jgi:hypothetical protein
MSLVSRTPFFLLISYFFLCYASQIIEQDLHVAQSRPIEQSVCLGFTADGNKWAISPDSTDEIVPMEYEVDFALLIDLSAQPQRN